MGNREYVLKKCAGIMDLVPGDNILGVEVGVFGAQLSSTLLPEYPRLRRLYGVDPYAEFVMRPHWPQERWDELHDAVQKMMSQYGDRWKLIRMKSLNAVGSLPNDLDFVYLDGDHSLDVVAREIIYYDWKIKKGGLLCGHDYIGIGEPGVQPAVEKMAVVLTRDLHFEEELNMWWWRKP